MPHDRNKRRMPRTKWEDNIGKRKILKKIKITVASGEKFARNGKKAISTSLEEIRGNCF